MFRVGFTWFFFLEKSSEFDIDDISESIFDPNISLTSVTLVMATPLITSQSLLCSGGIRASQASLSVLRTSQTKFSGYEKGPPIWNGRKFLKKYKKASRNAVTRSSSISA